MSNRRIRSWDPLEKPTDIIGFDTTGKNLAKNLVPLISQKEICFFDEKIKYDPMFHYLDFEQMLEKSEIMIFTTELPKEYFKNINKINKKVKIFIPRKFKDTIKILKAADLKKNLVII